MSVKLTKSQQVIFNNILAALQQATVTPAKAVPAGRKAKRALPATHPVAQIAQAKATKGKVVCEGEALATARSIIAAIPADAVRFTLSIGDKGWAFIGKVCTEITVTKAQAAKVRKQLPATLTTKA